MATLPPAVAATPHATPLTEHHYQCERCSACCRWPGEVVLEEGEVDAIAAFLEMDLDQFIAQYTALRTNRQGLTLTMREDGACSMLEGNSCRINPVKPRQCAGFPNAWRFQGWHKLCQAKLVENPVEPNCQTQ